MLAKISINLNNSRQKMLVLSAHVHYRQAIVRLLFGSVSHKVFLNHGKYKVRALSTALIKRWKKLLDAGEKGGEGSRGEKEKERKGEKKEKEEKGKKGKDKEDSKEAVRDSAREQSKESCTGDEVRDRSVLKSQMFCYFVLLRDRSV